MTEEAWAAAWKEDREVSKEPQPHDLAAMQLLHEILPANKELIKAGEHDQIWFSVSCRELQEILSGNDIEKLSSYGVFYDDDLELLSMFR